MIIMKSMMMMTMMMMVIKTIIKNDINKIRNKGKLQDEKTKN